MASKDEFIQKIVKFAEGIPAVQEMSKVTGLSVQTLTFGTLAAIIFFILISICPTTTIILIGGSYPFYFSIKVLESNNINDGKECLKFWFIFGIFSLIDPILDLLLSFLPLYFLLRVGLMVFLFWPQTRGAVILYDTMKPHMDKYQKKFEDFLEGIAKQS
ncbi:unnamed protein product [Blepharisma stoltei]|uniref:Receptor expression-enhancing protein n=1 Tax=Blepharisma stoltei TaxID=1481888 RepID=A0AAU9IUD4_9CILI|nr:unnamed protein product [Blepharisma stoltei]